MQLTGKLIAEQGIITGFDPNNIQQQGIDLRVESISIVGSGGHIPATGKTCLPENREVSCTEEGVWCLYPGYYEVRFMEGCEIPCNRVMVLIHRSSVIRCGAEIVSAQWDANFHTEKMGCFFKVNVPMSIEKGARLAQTRVFETEDVDENYLYNGQFQGK